MVSWNTGSVSTFVGNLVGWNTVNTLSGATMDQIVVNSINYVNSYITPDSIDPSGITEKYQPVISKLTHADVLIALESQQGGVDNVSLGELSISQAAGGGAELAKQLKEEANLRLKELQRRVRFGRYIGG